MSGNVGSRKPVPDPRVYEHHDLDDTIRVQKSMTARLVHGASGWQYYWYLCRHLRSRAYHQMEDAIEAMRTQGFGSYIDQDERRTRLR